MLVRTVLAKPLLASMIQPGGERGVSRRASVTFLSLVLVPPGGVLPYMGYMGMCRCEEYGFQAVYSRIGYINQSLWV